MKRLDTRAAIQAAGCAALVFTVALTSVQAAPGAQPTRVASAEHMRIVEHWSPARRAAALPRDLVLDERGQGYMQQPDGTLIPYGRTVAQGTGQPRPMAKPGGDTTQPTISSMDPSNKEIGASYTFKATVTDASGLRSVSFRIARAGAAAQSFNATLTTNNVYVATLSGFTDGSWSWTVVAKDKANNTATSPSVGFTVSTGGGGGGGGSIVVNEPWLTGGDLQTAAGRIYFEMPANARRTRWAGYVCSGTVVNDVGAVAGRSVILTAAHCVYDDANKAFARNVLFIPDQDETSASGTDLNCGNDRLGCWSTWFGVVDDNWASRSFPDNIPWDYAYYVVQDTGAHTGTAASSDALDVATTGLMIDFNAPESNGTRVTHALGYSYSDDPNFMYCAEAMTTEGADNWWLPSCGLSGGSSGGPWVQPMDGGTGPVISVNSWGYTGEPGMAGPKLSGTSASCVFNAAKLQMVPDSVPAGDAGIAVTDC